MFAISLSSNLISIASQEGQIRTWKLVVRTYLAEVNPESGSPAPSFLISHNDSKIAANRALPAELADQTTPYDPSAYIDLIVRSAANLLRPFHL
jgi:hypothetical protein